MEGVGGLGSLAEGLEANAKVVPVACEIGLE